jgi:hypothetical protein
MVELTGLNQTSAGTGIQSFENVSEKTKTKKSKKDTQTIDLLETRDMIIACQQESEQIYTNLRNIWNNCWDMYCNNQDYSKKADWQSKVFIPELNPAIKKATSTIRRILVQAGEYFDIKDPIMTDNIRDLSIPAQKAALKYHLNSSKFDTKLIQAIEVGFTFGTGALKEFWIPQEKCRIDVSQTTSYTDIFSPPQTKTLFEEVKWMSSGFAAYNVDPRQLWFDPDHTYIIEESMTTLPEIMALSKVKMPDGSFYYDPKQVDKLKAEDYAKDSKETERLTSLGLLTATNEFRRNVHLYEYWGPVYNRQGEMLKKNARIVLANKRYVLNTDNIENPMRFYGPLYGKPPYIIFSPIDFLFRLEGQSLIEGAISLQKAINNLTNMSLDGLLWKLLKLFEVNPDRLRNPEVLVSLKPGKPILTSGEGQAIKEIPISDVPRGALAETEILRKALQNSDFVTDFRLALGTKNTTATEYEGSSRESDSMFESIGRNLEETLIEPSIEMARQIIVQFWDDFRDPTLQQIAKSYGLPFSALTREERVAFMLKTSWVESRGISSYFEKTVNLKKMVDFLGVISKIPPAMKRINWRNLIDRIISCFSFPNPSELIITEQEEQQVLQQDAMQEKARQENLRMQSQAFDMKKRESQAKTASMGMPPGQAPPQPGNGGGVSPEVILQALMQGQGGGGQTIQ